MVLAVGEGEREDMKLEGRLGSLLFRPLRSPRRLNFILLAGKSYINYSFQLWGECHL